MKKKSQKVWIESDENMLDGVDINKVIPRLDEVLEKKKREAKEVDPPDYIEQRILDHYPTLTLERLREMLKCH